MPLPVPNHAERSRQHPSPVLAVRAAPFGRAQEKSAALMWSLAGCAAGLMCLACVYYGPRALLLAAVCACCAALMEATCCWLCHRRWRNGMGHSVAIGLIVGLMLPATSPWFVAGAGAALAVGAGKWLMGGLGHYPWNPAVLALLVLHLVWPEFVAPQRWPLLSKEHAVVGNWLQLGPLANCQAPQDWQTTEPPGETVGFASPRADTVLSQAATTDGAASDAPLDTAVRDLLPSWWDMLTGALPGPMGQGSTLALVLAGLVLIWRGYLRWPLPLAVLTGALLAAALLPIAPAGWWPIRYTVDGIPLGLMWAGYHVLLGPTLFVAVLLAGETVTSPITNRGQIVYGLGVGALTVALRWSPVAILAGCWAVLAMNTLVPVIERLERRWRLVAGR